MIVQTVTAETVESMPLSAVAPPSAVPHLTAVPPLAPEPAARPVRSLVLLGDSGPFGIGDPVPGGGWRGFGPLLRDALGGPETVRYVNTSVLGARAAGVRANQLPDALREAPDVAVLMVGMNDTLRSDFDAEQLRDDLDAIVGSLLATGCTVLTVRFHDHSRVFHLPGPLRRALHRRITELNAVIDDVVARHRIDCLDLDTMPGGYDRSTWSVDRLHPSEVGHRLLAHHFVRMLAARGFTAPHPVSLASAGGREITRFHCFLWLVFKGLPWLCSRGRDLIPYAISIILRDLFSRPEPGGQRVAAQQGLGEEAGHRGQPLRVEPLGIGQYQAAAGLHGAEQQVRQ